MSAKRSFKVAPPDSRLGDSTVAVVFSSAVNPNCSADVPPFQPNQLKLRFEQYTAGFEAFFRFWDSARGTRFYWVDNTISSKNELPDTLQKMLKDVTSLETIFFSDNRLGLLNKGAGLLIQWQRFLRELPPHAGRVIHFEPRLQLTSQDFLAYAQSSPNPNIAKVNTLWGQGRWGIPYRTAHMETGLFSIDRCDLEAFVAKTSPEEMAAKSISIEYSLFRFMTKSPNGLQHVEKLHVTRFAPEGPYEI